MTCDDVRELAAGFVLGALSTDEAQAVRSHLATCPEDHREFALLGGVVSYLADTLAPVEPPPALRSRILAAAGASAPSRAAAGVGVLAEPGEPGLPAAERARAPDGRALRRGRGVLSRWLLPIAAAVAIALLGGWNVVLQRDVSGLRTFEDRTAEALALAAQPGARLAVLAPGEGAPGSPTGIAVLPASGRGRLVMRGLRRTDGDEVYQAWVIAAGKAPRPAGSFRVGDDGLGYLDRLDTSEASGVTIALTREPGPNAMAPTLPIVSSGPATAVP